ncbi:MAG TPA: alanine--glyoxylate aminotransferase family protein, partial [Candidatus Dormibacteraeota bacterium]|nr:alanine--glyoxylate aminotransferase family protein [Candidatus Dormibacteraeota bacterium]
VPGPTPVPRRVVDAMAVPMINHRGPAFAALITECREGLQWAFQTKNEIVMFPSSGTGGLEAAVANLTSPGEKAVFVSIGSFGDRFIKIAEAYGVDVVKVEYEWGKGAQPEDVARVLDENANARVLFIQHNETSTGVCNDLVPIAAVARERGRLVVVDGVSSVSSINLPMDELGIDVVLSGSQKGWMLPPGLSFVAASPAALEYSRTTRCPRFYFDINKELEFELKGQTFTTPPVSIIFGLRESLRMLREEGLKEVFARHSRVAGGVRRSIQALELDLFADPRYYSNTVTAVKAPRGDEALNKQLVSTLRDKYQLELAGGQGKLAGQIFRIGHLGDISDDDGRQIISRLEQALVEIGYIDAPVGAVDAYEESLGHSAAVAPPA